MKSQPFPDPVNLPKAHPANLFQVRYEPCVFEIYFGEEGGFQEHDTLKIGVALPAPLFKEMISHLYQKLNEYERRYGIVPDYDAETGG